MNCESQPMSTDRSGDLVVTTAVVTAISDLARVDPVDLDFCLADHVDPDAMEALFAGNVSSGTELTMVAGPYEVSVRSVGEETVVTASDGDRRSRTVVDR